MTKKELCSLLKGYNLYFEVYGNRRNRNNNSYTIYLNGIRKNISFNLLDTHNQEEIKEYIEGNFNI